MKTRKGNQEKKGKAGYREVTKRRNEMSEGRNAMNDNMEKFLRNNKKEEWQKGRTNKTGKTKEGSEGTAKEGS